jgi:hypothetical protein
MNRIFLIGNGFDLAHGLKTSYIDFIDNFWDKKKNAITDGLKQIWEGSKTYYKYEDEVIEFISPCEISKLPSFANTNTSGFNWFKILLSSKYSININGYDIYVHMEIKNIFLNYISALSLLTNWVDIEAIYYLLLNECAKGESSLNIDTLNNDFSYVKFVLKIFLLEQIKTKPIYLNNVIDLLGSIIEDAIFKKDTYDFTKNRILFLVFNYTNTEQHYLDYYVRKINHSIECIHIHGELEDSNNPIIFGYGDEIDENYKKIENLNDNRYLDNVKSINYLLTNNYKKLLEFINDGEYQIYIMGHSCGISDRTLLNKLFEHQSCKSIKVFYHSKEDGTDNFTSLVQNISRNFNDNSKMREIVVEKTGCLPLQ